MKTLERSEHGQTQKVDLASEYEELAEYYAKHGKLPGYVNAAVYRIVEYDRAQFDARVSAYKYAMAMKDVPEE